MASFFDKVADKVNNLGNKVAQKTTTSTENIRLSSSVKDEERQINETYMAIGKKYREIFGENPAPEFAELIADIEKREALVNEYRKKIQQNKGKTNCENCGNEIEATAPFCAKCGTKNPMAEEIARAKAEAEARAKAEEEAKAQAAACAVAQAAAQAAAAQAQATAAVNAQTAQTAAETSAAPANNAPAESAPVFCKNCGNAIAAGNVFCTNCGTRVD